MSLPHFRTQVRAWRGSSRHSRPGLRPQVSNAAFRFRWEERALGGKLTPMPESRSFAALPAKVEAAGVEPAVPWYIRCTVTAVTSGLVGGYWDISWHMTIGRDTFWTPAHLAVYLCGVLAGTSSASLIFSVTLRSDEARHEAGVEIWGFRGLLGAFKRACLRPACNSSKSLFLPQHHGGPISFTDMGGDATTFARAEEPPGTLSGLLRAARAPVRVRKSLATRPRF